MMNNASVRSLVILRALDLGDMLCAVPAFRAIRRGYPNARISLCGLPWARDFAAHYRSLFDDFIEFPGFEGLPERPVDYRVLEDFPNRMAVREFDLAIQMHGSGSIVNQLLPLFGAKKMAGYHPVGTVPPAGIFAPWEDGLHEIETWLRLTDALGVARSGADLEFPCLPEDRTELEELQQKYRLEPRSYAVLHAGAKWQTRQWPPEAFAQVARILSRDHQIVLTGVEREKEITSRVADLTSGNVIDLAGETTLGGFAGVLRDARVVVTNDTGASHLAVAVETPSVTVALGSDTARWAPLNKALHPTFALKVPCRPCGFQVCPYSHECADIEPTLVARTANRISNWLPVHYAYSRGVRTAVPA